MTNKERLIAFAKGLVAFLMFWVMAFGMISGTICTWKMGNPFLGIMVFVMGLMAVPTFVKALKWAGIIKPKKEE